MIADSDIATARTRFDVIAADVELCRNGHPAERIAGGKCRECARLSSQRYRNTHPDKMAAHQARARAQRKQNGKAAAYSARTQASGQQRVWNLASYRRRQAAGKVNEYARRRRATDTNFRLTQNLNRSLRRLLSRNAVSSRSSAARLLGCSIAQFREHLARMFGRSLSWKNYGTVWDIDHIRPLAGFDLLDPAQLAAACHFTNLRPLRKKANKLKGGRLELLL